MTRFFPSANTEPLADQAAASSNHLSKDDVLKEEDSSDAEEILELMRLAKQTGKNKNIFLKKHFYNILQ